MLLLTRKELEEPSNGMQQNLRTAIDLRNAIGGVAIPERNG